MVATFDDEGFAIRVDPSRRLVEIDLRGYWDLATCERYKQALVGEALPFLVNSGCALGDQITLIDATGYQVQSQEVTAFHERMTSNSSIRSRRVAVMVSSVLLKMQARRAAPGYSLFADRDEAVRWLFEPVA